MVSDTPTPDGPVTVLLGGDVMLGRGVDQILPHPGDPILREPWARDARHYMEAAERANGPIPHPVDASWPWGQALTVLDRLAPSVRLINLETTITADGEFAPDKGIHYRMHPGNLAALAAFSPDVCALANNHILDFGHPGLRDTLDALAETGVGAAGAGKDLAHASEPVIVETEHRTRVIVASVADPSSGVRAAWAARPDAPGVWLVDVSSGRHAADRVTAGVLAHKRDNDIAIVSVHWGPNWGYGIARSETQFAHHLIDADVDIVHGHSAHHPRPIEIYRGKPILYGCGDVINDYEGIGGHEGAETALPDHVRFP
ncbi:poly-gamma-glutamate synthesis protein (capsule biosynthesis protein) [Nocardia pseudobrasiliensis]|uniref:Poly-gamma-glutamate synthesis protein (Capsule biosynthesis protein) n=1 Tax=Nocardia pseudobrasiliensis TaxID=45979 RepID=A0A370HPG8_9NOCA|nr:poly-gamma-glutamate synthesis protein (capsule biosynthesis protein) [Nocardia pseudobrasiliensis]